MEQNITHYKKCLSHSYILDNGKSYKYYELQPIKEVEMKEIKQQKTTRQKIKNINTGIRRFRKEGLDRNKIIYKTHYLRSKK